MGFLGERSMEVSGDWVNCHCPLAPWRHGGGTDRNPSFGVRIEPGDSRVWCFSCHFGGTQTSLLFELRRLLKGEVHTIDIKSAMQAIVDVEGGDEDRPLILDEPQGGREDFVFPEVFLERFAPARWSDLVHPYLGERRVPFEVAEELDLRFSHSEDRICFPIRNWNGDLVGLHGRAVLDEIQPRYRMITYKGRKNPLAWLGEAWINISKPVVVAESVFDLARVYQVYRNVMCPLTTSVSVRKIRRIARCDLIYTMFDPDEAGRHARRKVEQVLGDDCFVDHIELVREGRDPGDMSVGEVAHRLRGLVDLDDVLS